MGFSFIAMEWLVARGVGPERLKQLTLGLAEPRVGLSQARS